VVPVSGVATYGVIAVITKFVLTRFDWTCDLGKLGIALVDDDRCFACRPIIESNMHVHVHVCVCVCMCVCAVRIREEVVGSIQ
jgi:hypothetical protein